MLEKLVYFKNIKESELIFNSNPIKGCPAISGKCSLLVLTSESFTHRISIPIVIFFKFSIQMFSLLTSESFAHRLQQVLVGLFNLPAPKKILFSLILQFGHQLDDIESF